MGLVSYRPKDTPSLDAHRCESQGSSCLRNEHAGRYVGLRAVNGGFCARKILVLLTVSWTEKVVPMARKHRSKKTAKKRMRREKKAREKRRDRYK